jgi:hypothetical protein
MISIPIKHWSRSSINWPDRGEPVAPIRIKGGKTRNGQRKAGKKVLHYFCTRAIPPDQIDEAQRRALSRYKKTIQDNCYYEQYATEQELRTNILRAIDKMAREIREADSPLPAILNKLSGTWACQEIRANADGTLVATLVGNK